MPAFVDIRLVVLDFDGVCTLSPGELPPGPAPALADIIRPGAIQLVADARERNVGTAVLSNELAPTWVSDVPLLGDVDHVVSCADNKIFKPDRRAFLRCARLAECEPEQIVVVDDGPDNITVASSIGMHAVLFDPAAPVASWAQVREVLAWA